MFRVLLITVFLFVCISPFSFSAIIKSNGTGGGDWTSNATWVDEFGNPINRTPQDGDEIIIDTGDLVLINTIIPGFLQTLDNVIIAVRGTLSFDDPPGLDRAALLLDTNSLIVIESGGTLTGTGSNNEYLRLGGFPGTQGQWNSNTDGTISGPQYIDTGGIQPGTPPGYVPLPIELISFNANLSGEVVEISWATAAEIDNDYFTLERSEDGINWNIIGEEAGAGNSTVRLDYRFVDYNPVPGLSYYRLKQTDYDGQFEYFDPAVVLYEPDNLFKVFPNPTTDYIQLTTSSELNNAVISIKNLNGQQQSIAIDPSNHQANIDLSGLPTGVYLLEIVFPESVLSKRIVKK